MNLFAWIKSVFQGTKPKPEPVGRWTVYAVLNGCGVPGIALLAPTRKKVWHIWFTTELLERWTPSEN